MAHHGAVIAGRDRDEAFRRAKLLEAVCRRACKSRPEAAPDLDAALACRLTDAAERAFGHAAYTGAAPVLRCAADGKAVFAQLDDMAQMIGPRLCAAKPEERAVLRALRHRAAVLIPGVGAVCRADSEGDCRALCLLIEKACVCRLHTAALGIGGRLSRRDVRLMRRVYLKKYSKRIGG
jgi:ribulose-5-phosphate 4-epimerase/fuculose-1-phosphate aldolase